MLPIRKKSLSALLLLTLTVSLIACAGEGGSVPDTAADGIYCVSCTAGMTETQVTQTLAELMEANAK